ncbi:MFS transporter [Advenella kashmirensis W13003]|uniref:MFS transporter n=1 Tax=Advenella kashmirensis W13003 TaxID=1424334 RepID=V8QXH9_9BURK|nr:tripartite tricarboxylate transporter substrate binding protein [Advenella kashmirensis]ETF03734.1 MFS transporter [Advenella kashmirensis W13003]
MIKHYIAKTALAVAAVAIATAAHAAYPEKPITIVVGFPPGTSTDAVARILANKMGKDLGQPFIVENKPGVGGSLGAGMVARSKPDGYTVVLSATAPMNINPHVYKSLPYDAGSDFEPVGQTTWLPYILVINNTKNIKTFQDLIGYAKKNPEKLTYASIGKGTTSHLLMELLMKRTGTKMVHIPYSGSTQSQTDVIGGNVDMTFDTVVSAMPHVKSGKLNALAVSVANRAKLAPDVPTIQEQGVTNFNMGAWLGIFAPKGTPRDIVDKLHTELNKALSDKETNAKLVALGSEVVMSESPEAFKKMVQENYDTWGNIVKDAGVDQK